jgi:hypothetical protein
LETHAFRHQRIELEILADLLKDSVEILKNGGNFETDGREKDLEARGRGEERDRET